MSAMHAGGPPLGEPPWVSYTLYFPIGRMRKVHDRLLPHLKVLAKEPGLRFNFNHYEAPDPHISVRVSQPQPELEKAFKGWHREGLLTSWRLSEGPGYDAPLRIRRAYELASRLYLELDDMLETLAPDLLPDQEFFGHLFHGLRNNLMPGEMPREEAWFWLSQAMRIFPAMKE